MKVQDVMTVQVYSVGRGTPVSRVAKLIVDHGITGVPVIDTDNNLLGLISEKDLLRTLFPDHKTFFEDVGFFHPYEKIANVLNEVNDMRAEQIMTENVVTACPTDHLLRAASLMLLNNIRRLPVVEGTKLVGIISTNDIFHLLISRGFSLE